MNFSDSEIKAGVMAWPASHSLSPHLHRYWLKIFNINGTYDPIEVAPEHFANVLRSLPEKGFSGVNITLPHKVAALKVVDTADHIARRIGAVNTIIIKTDGSLEGTNTDAFGFLENISNIQPNWDARSGPAVVLGAGGAARAICVALLDAGVPEIRLLNRTRLKADVIGNELGGAISTIDWEKRSEALSDAAFLVNTTSLGMKGMAPLDIELSSLPKSASVCDIVYTPIETGLLAAARARGNIAIDGLGMLLHQARPGFEAWFGKQPDVTDELRQVVLRALGQ